MWCPPWWSLPYAMVRPSEQVHAVETLWVFNSPASPSFWDDHHSRLGISHRWAIFWVASDYKSSHFSLCERATRLWRKIPEARHDQSQLVLLLVSQVFTFAILNFYSKLKSTSDELEEADGTQTVVPRHELMNIVSVTQLEKDTILVCHDNMVKVLSECVLFLSKIAIWHYRWLTCKINTPAK